jgi:large subunit ribosomal protein L25
MSESFEVVAEPRTDAGKGASRRLRRTGQVPAIVYGGHEEPQMISLRHNELIQHLEDEAFYSHILDLKVGDTASRVVLKDLQRHPAKPFILHVDFQRVMMDEKLRMVVPLHFLNEGKSKGVKAGGVVSHNLNEIEVTCLPQDLPEFIDVDVTDLDIGDILHLSEVVLPEGVELAHAPDPDVPVIIIHGAHAGVGEEGPEAEGEEGGESEV